MANPESVLPELTPEERRFLDLSIQGATDEEIASEMNLSPAKVLAQRLRLRSRLGTLDPTPRLDAFSNVELRRRHTALSTEHRRLKERLQRAKDELKETLALTSALRSRSLHLLALDHTPCATILACPPATVAFANGHAHRLFRAAPGSLSGLPIAALTHPGLPEGLREPTRWLFEERGVDQETFGIDRPFYASRRDGTSFRAVAEVRRFEGDQGQFAVMTIRELLPDAHTLVQALRQPLDLR